MGYCNNRPPIGWMSDRMDRRILIMFVSLGGGVAAAAGALFDEFFVVLMGVSFLVGGLSNPLYALLLAYTNDYLDGDDMAAASGGLIFINGCGAIAGPIITGWMMGVIGPHGFWMFVALLMTATGAYAAWRMTRRPATVSTEDTASYAPLTPVATSVAVEVAQEYYAENIEEAGSDAVDETATDTRA
ncbi:MAG: MFS transporter, partial [Pseudomonadota bacterium]